MSTRRFILFGLLNLVAAGPAAAVSCEALQVDELGYVVCRVDVRIEGLQLAYTDSGGARFESFEALRRSLARAGRKLTFAMNAGMFHPDFSPVGLLVIDGKTITPINRADGPGNFFLQPNGVFMIDATGARVLATDEFREHKPLFATQSGPMLVHRGQIPGSFAFRADSTSRHIRNGVCVQGGIAAFAISNTPVSFYEFARLFQVTLRCDEALYLDGAISSLYAPQFGRADRRAKLGPLFAASEPDPLIR